MTYGDPNVDMCVSDLCCAEFFACYNDSICMNCMIGQSGAECATLTAFTAFNTCSDPCLQGTAPQGICGTYYTYGVATVDNCVQGSCCTEFAACHNDPVCFACVKDPAGAGCATSSLFVTLLTCSGPCGVPMPPQPGLCGTEGSFGDTNVDACIAASCCTEFTACYTDSTCLGCLEGVDNGCGTNALLNAFYGCAGPCLQ